MEISTVWGVYWSATGTTRTVVRAMAEEAAHRLHVPVRIYDGTWPEFREKELRFSKTDLAVVGTPTYAGKVPNKLLPWFQSKLKGGGALAIPVVLFGNRSYDNALAELTAVLKEDGFHPLAAAAFVGQHAFSDTLAAGRPNREDLALARRFAGEAAERARNLSEPPAAVQVPGDPDGAYYVPRGTDGQPVRFLKAKPGTKPELCNGCGRCVTLCPMAAIDPVDVTLVPGTCIKCQACVRGCPSGAKYFDDPAFLSHVAMLEANFQKRKSPEVFL